MVEAR
jgi:hypothetical protein